MKASRWRTTSSLVVGLGLGLPGLATVRLGGGGGLRVEPPLGFRVTPDGEWTGAWGPTMRTVAEFEQEWLRTAVALVAALAAGVWLAGLSGYLLGRLRDVASRRAEWALRSGLGASPRQLRREVVAEGLRDLARAAVPGAGLCVATAFFLLRPLPGRLDARVDLAGLLLTPAAGMILLATGVAAVGLPLLAFPPPRLLRRPANAAALALRGDVIGMLSVVQLAAALGLAACALIAADGAPRERMRVGDEMPHARDTVVLRAHLPEGLEPERRSAAWIAARTRLETLPGVEVATVTTPGGLLGVGPVDAGGALCSSCTGGGLAVPVSLARARHIGVDEGYFEVLGIAGVPPRGNEVAIETGMRRRWFHGSRAAGGRTSIRGRLALRDLHHVVAGPTVEMPPFGPGAGRGRNADAPDGSVYLPLGSAAPRVADMGIRLADVPGHAVEVTVEGAVRAIEAEIPNVGIEVLGPLDALIAADLGVIRRLGRACLGLAVGACLLGLLGVAMGMAERIRLRRREIGIRRAVGARRPALLRLVLVDAARLSALGGLAGLALAVSAGRGLPDVLPELTPLPPVTIAVLILSYVAAAVAGSLAAAGVALSVDPIDAVRG